MVDIRCSSWSFNTALHVDYVLFWFTCMSRFHVTYVYMHIFILCCIHALKYSWAHWAVDVAWSNGMGGVRCAEQSIRTLKTNEPDGFWNKKTWAHGAVGLDAHFLTLPRKKTWEITQYNRHVNMRNILFHIRRFDFRFITVYYVHRQTVYLSK
jgi:hypothetical protein